ncbi:MAG: HD domain-containing protein, partial [Mogibacterium sp.]|nr:HD domain-containing protein [Mogibacterium sp.]
LDMSDFVKSAPEKPIDMYEYIIGEINAMQDEDFKKLCLHLYEGNKEKLMYYPAAMSNHHAEYGGLLYHIKRMMMSANKLCEVYTNLSRDLLVAGVAIHDIEKLNEILSDKNGISPGYSFKGQMLGHIVQGITLVNDLCKELGISEEKAVLLEHMILSHHYEPEFGSPKKPLFPEAEMLHYLDIVDARMFDMEEGLKGVSDGEFGDRVWPLDNRRLYKRTF